MQPVHAGQCPVQCRLRGRRAPLLEGPAESRTADDRDRPRSAQSDRHDPAGARRQGRLPHRRHRPGAVDHPAAGHPAGSHVDPVSDQRATAPAQIKNLPFQQARAADLLKQVAEIDKSIDILRQQYALQQQSAAAHPRAGRGVSRRPSPRRQGPARQDRQLRRLLPAAAQLLLLGAALFRHPGLLGAAIALRRARRYRRADRPVGQRHGEHRQAGCAAAEAAGADSAADRQPANQSRPDDDELRHHVGNLRPDRGGAAERHRPGRGVRRVEDRRLLLPAAGGVQQLRVPARPEAVPLAGRQGRADDHHPRRRSRYPRRHFAHRRDPARRAGGRQGHAAGGVQDLHRRHRGDLQGHPGHGASTT